MSFPKRNTGSIIIRFRSNLFPWRGAGGWAVALFLPREALSAAPYDRITCRLHFYLPAAGEGFSSRAYYASKGIPILAYLDQYTEPEIVSTTKNRFIIMRFDPAKAEAALLCDAAGCRGRALRAASFWEIKAGFQKKRKPSFGRWAYRIFWRYPGCI